MKNGIQKVTDLLAPKRVFVFFLLITSVGVFAQSSGDLPWESSLSWIIDILTGTTGRLIFVALIAILAITMAVVGGQGVKEKVFWVVIGGGVLFGATQIVGALFKASGGN